MSSLSTSHDVITQAILVIHDGTSRSTWNHCCCSNDSLIHHSWHAFHDSHAGIACIGNTSTDMIFVLAISIALAIAIAIAMDMDMFIYPGYYVSKEVAVHILQLSAATTGW